MEINTAKRILKTATLLTAGTLINACSNSNNLIQDRQTTRAPQSVSDVGVLLDGAKAEDVKTLLSHHAEAKVRVLNANHGLYEILGVSHDQVKQEYSGSSEPNQFFEFKPRKSMGALSMPIGRGVQVGNLRPCVDSNTPPTAVLTVEAPAADINGAVLNLGTKIRVNTNSSKANAAAPSALQTLIVLEQPEAAGTPEILHPGAIYEFTPGALGAYKMAVMVQDANGACAVDQILFIVSAQRPYTGPHTQMQPINVAKFAHLGMVSAPQAWSISQGDGIIIAIVDSGVDYNHPYLAPNILVNSGETPDNGIDDDNNGFIDDYVGYNFAYNVPYPYDDDSHGTHVAGLAAAKQFGLAQNAKILPVKALTPVGGDIGSIAAGIRYAVDRGANIINLSIGGNSATPPAALFSAVQYAKSKGVLVIAAAGNGDPQTGLGLDNDVQPSFPANFSQYVDNVLTVAAYDASDDITSYSNFGLRSVGITAPGGTMPNDPMISAAFENPNNAMFVEMVGTSMATPVVSGIAAQVWSLGRGRSYLDVKNILLASGPDVASLKTKTISGKHLNSLSAVQNAQNAAPAVSTASF